MRMAPEAMARRLASRFVDVDLRMNAKTVMTELEKIGGRPFCDGSKMLCSVYVGLRLSEPDVVRPDQLCAAR
jgi:hypothetical protein